MTEVGLIAKMKLGGDGFVQPTLGNMLASDTTPELARPDLGGAVEALPEEPLQLSQGHGAQGSHDDRSKLRPLG